MPVGAANPLADGRESEAHTLPRIDSVPKKCYTLVHLWLFFTIRPVLIIGAL